MPKNNYARLILAVFEAPFPPPQTRMQYFIASVTNFELAANSRSHDG